MQHLFRYSSGVIMFTNSILLFNLFKLAKNKDGFHQEYTVAFSHSMK